jgi:tryptophan synthase alpha chain
MKKLIPFLTAGYPTRKGCGDYIRACVAGGADGIEIGIPFSDPLADGPVIQASSQAALENGTTPADAFALAGKVKSVPVYFMTYLNPVHRYGVGRFLSRAKKAGVSGLIVPDLPPEEAGTLFPKAPLIFLCSPTCTEVRIRKVDRASRGWIYLVALRGVTGARKGLASDLSSFVRRVQQVSRKPLYIGFGISTPKDAAKAAALADGIVVGSAILRRIASGEKPAAVEKFIRSLRRAIDQ